MIKIGVIIPTYERKELLLRALVSLQKQTYENWEAYVVDDSSSEDVKSYLDTGLTKGKSKRNKGIKAFRKQTFKEF